MPRLEDPFSSLLLLCITAMCEGYVSVPLKAFVEGKVLVCRMLVKEIESTFKVDAVSVEVFAAKVFNKFVCRGVEGKI